MRAKKVSGKGQEVRGKELRITADSHEGTKDLNRRKRRTAKSRMIKGPVIPSFDRTGEHGAGRMIRGEERPMNVQHPTPK